MAGNKVRCHLLSGKEIVQDYLEKQWDRNIIKSDVFFLEPKIKNPKYNYKIC